MDMGIVNAGQLVVYEDIPKELLEHVEDIIFNRRPDATERLVEFAATIKGGGAKKAQDLAWREAPVEARLSHALVHGVVDFIEVDVEEARQTLSAAARHHRRSADGRDEDRRRAVRFGQDVPAAGREERARDEEGGGVSRAVHGSGTAGPDGGRRRRRDRVAGQDRPGDRERRRPRHRQEHRRRRARLQQLRRRRSRRDGAVRQDPADGDRREGRPDRLERPDHAVARRDGVRRQGDGAAPHSAAAPHRRRDDEQAAHGGEDRARVRRIDRPRARRVARGRRRVESAERLGASRVRGGEPRAAAAAARAVQRPPRAAAAAVRRRAEESPADRLGRPRRCRRRRSSAAARCASCRSRRSCRTSTGRSSSPRGN